MIKKLFGSIDMTWTKVILFAVITAVYTALINQVPFLLDTSFRDIAISYEWWVLFALIIMANCKSPFDASAKTFVFFVISQPLIYLIEVPFLGWDVFSYYINWIIPTLATIPMAFVGWYLKEGKIWSYFAALLPITVLLAVHAVEFFSVATYSFPNHLLSGIFCVFEIFLFLYVFFDTKKMRIVGSVINSAIIALMAVYIILTPFQYNTMVLSSTDELCFDDSWSVTVTGNNIGEFEIVYNEMIDDYVLNGDFKRSGKTEFVLSNSDKSVEQSFSLNVGNNTYDISPK